MAENLSNESLENVTGGAKYEYNGKVYNFCLTVPGNVMCPKCSRAWGYLTYCPMSDNDLDTNILHCDNCGNIWTQRCF